MVNLPLRQPQLVETQLPQSRVTPGAIENAGDAIATGLNKLSTGLENVAVPFAEQEGRDAAAKAVTLNPDGSLNVQQPAGSFILGRAGDAYEHAATAGVIAAQSTATATKLTELRQQFQSDPQGFRTAANSYLQSALGGRTGDVANALMQDGQRQIGQHYDNAVEQKARQDTALSKDAIDTQINTQRNQLQALARAPGGTDTDQFKQASARYQSYVDSLAANPKFGYSKESAEADKAKTAAIMQGEAVVAQVDRDYSRGPGGKAAAQERLQALSTNPDLPESDRNRLYHMGLARLDYLSGANKEAVDANRKATSSAIEAIRSGAIQPTDPQLDITNQNSRTIGDSESVDAVNAARTEAFRRHGAQGLTGPQFMSTFGGSMSAPAASISRAILGQESGNNSNVGNSIDGARGPGQIMPATFATYAKPGERIDNPADNRAVHARIIEDYTQRYHGDAARVAVAYFSGPGNVAPPGMSRPYVYDSHDGNGKYVSSYVSDVLGRVQRQGGGVSSPAAPFDSNVTGLPAQSKETGSQLTPDPRFAGPGGKISYDRDGHPIPVSQQGDYAGWTADQLAGRAPPPPVGSPSANGVHYSLEQIRANPFLASEYYKQAAMDGSTRIESAKQLGETLKNGYGFGHGQPADKLTSFYQSAQMYPDKLGKLSDEVQGAAKAHFAARLGETAGQQYIDNLQDEARTTPDLHQQAIADAALAAYQHREKNLVEHPFAEAANRGWIPQPPAPIDPSQPATIPQALQDRVRAAHAIGSFTGNPAPPILDKTDTPALQHALAGPQGAQVLSGISGALPQASMHDFLQNDEVRKSIVGMGRSGDPAKMTAAYAFMDGQQRQNPLQFDAQFPDGLKDLRTWQGMLSFFPPEEAAKRMLASYDPNQQVGRKAADEAANTELKNVPPASVVSKFSTWALQPSGDIGIAAQPPMSATGDASADLKADYDFLYRDARMSGQDASTADKYATEKLANKYSVSPTNGNQVMANAPEKAVNPKTGQPFYPQVGGSYGWMAQQVDTDVKGFFRDRAQALYPGETQMAKDNYAANVNAAHWLIPDDKTQADIAAGRPPSYTLVVKDAASGRTAVASDARGMPMRLRFDPSQAQSAARQSFDQTRDAVQSFAPTDAAAGP